MEIINIKATDATPKVILDPIHQIFEISGRSLPEDADEFYETIQLWLSNYVKQATQEIEFVFKFEYFNSASLKNILGIFHILEKADKVRAVWYYHEQDEIIDIMDFINIPTDYKVFS
jgi:hypothetical protein